MNTFLFLNKLNKKLNRIKRMNNFALVNGFQPNLNSALYLIENIISIEIHICYFNL